MEKQTQKTENETKQNCKRTCKCNSKTAEKTEKCKRGTRGITLIALVLTIIVLLILAGVTIATLTGDNGILSQAQKAKESTEVAKFKDYQKYGATAQLGTVEVNGTALLQGWKYFYEDDAANGNIYLIYANYLESAQIPTATNILKNGYNVYASGSRDNLINYLKGETSTYSTVWNGFATGVETALNAKLAVGQKLTTGTVKANGAPTVEQFKGSYLGNYPTSGFDAKEVSQGADYQNTGSSSANADGYVYKVGTGNYDYYASLGNSNKALYFPETTYSQIRDANANPAQTGDTYGYWLARSFSWQL